MRTMKVNTATRESDEQFKTDKYLRCAVTNGKSRLILSLTSFFTPLADNMAASWLRQHSEYDGGSWSYWVIPQGVGRNIAPNSIQFITTQTGYIAPEGEQRYRMCIPGNYFEGEVSADAAGIIATLMIMNRLSWHVAEMGPHMTRSAGVWFHGRMHWKDYISIIQHPERYLIWRAILINRLIMTS